jgi:hypothetical protein
LFVIQNQTGFVFKISWSENNKNNNGISIGFLEGDFCLYVSESHENLVAVAVF